MVVTHTALIVTMKLPPLLLCRGKLTLLAEDEVFGATGFSYNPRTKLSNFPSSQ